MREMTILEALAEVRLLQKKVTDKQRQVLENLTRPKSRVDPLEKEGGSQEFVKRALQSIRDMENDIIAIRREINRASSENTITIGDITMSVSDWLVWRREILPSDRMFQQRLVNQVSQERNRLKDTRFNQNQVVPGEDLVVHIPETELAERGERIIEIEERLDGQISLMDAKTIVRVP